MKSNFKQVFSSFILIIVLNICATSIVITRVKDDYYSEINVIEYSNFFEAMENLDFAYLNQHKVSKDQKQFAKTLELVVNRDMKKAESGEEQIDTSLL